MNFTFPPNEMIELDDIVRIFEEIKLYQIDEENKKRVNNFYNAFIDIYKQLKQTREDKSCQNE